MSAAGTSQASPFTLRAVVIMVTVAVLGFISYVVLSAYAPDFRPTGGGNGGEHALSTSAVGYAGVTDLVRMTRGDVGLVRSNKDLSTPNLLVLTPNEGTDPAAIKRILDLREGLPTLIVLPKWEVMPLPARPAWVKGLGRNSGFALSMWLRDITEATLTDPSGKELRTIKGPKLSTTMIEAPGGALVAGIDDTATFILADPDVLNNLGLDKAAGAERAMAILDKMTPTGKGISFDLTLHGFGTNPNLLKLAFERPFLPLTLCILFATLLAGWHAMRRFGPTLHEGRKVAFGKRAIVENGAALLRLAGRRHRTGERYAMLTRDAVATATGAPTGLSGDALAAYLNKLNRDGEPFSSIADRAASAPDTRRLLAAARDLYQWKRTVTREH